MLRAMWMKRRTKGYRGVAVCLIVAVLLAVWLVPACFAVDAVEASGAISQAERDLGSAYAVVAEAEGAGADVSVLLNKLGSAGDFLSEAYAAFRTGDYADASALAMECSHAIEGVADDAARLKTDAEAARSNRLLFAVVESSVGLVLLVVFGFLGWKLLKQRYFRRALDMKPQVEEAS
jgi:hypothetical protein